MNKTTNPAEVRFTAKRASIWCNGNRRWMTIGRDKAIAMVQLGLAVDLTDSAHV